MYYLTDIFEMEEFIYKFTGKHFQVSFFKDFGEVLYIPFKCFNLVVSRGDRQPLTTLEMNQVLETSKLLDLTFSRDKHIGLIPNSFIERQAYAKQKGVELNAYDVMKEVKIGDAISMYDLLYNQIITCDVYWGCM